MTCTILCCTGTGLRPITRQAISSTAISRLPEIEYPFVTGITACYKIRQTPADAMTHKLQWTAGLFLLATAALCAADRRVNLIPKLQPGQTITYLIRFQSDKSVK